MTVLVLSLWFALIQNRAPVELYPQDVDTFSVNLCPNCVWSGRIVYVSDGLSGRLMYVTGASNVEK